MTGIPASCENLLYYEILALILTSLKFYLDLTFVYFPVEKTQSGWLHPEP